MGLADGPFEMGDDIELVLVVEREEGWIWVI